MELLKKLYCIHSKSRKEDKMLEFLINWLFENFPTDALVEMDKTGNVYVTKGAADTYPCIVAHVDQVQTIHSDDFEVMETEDILFGFSRTNRRTEGLGADDKNGVWIALKCLQKYEAIKVALFVGEEIGCVGSSDADMSFFDNCRYVLQCDRKGFGDLITEASLTELCSKEFAKATQCEWFNYKETCGMMTDVMTLKENGLKVSCVNMSCGYYEPHTDREFTIKYDLLNCLSFVEYIIENVTDVYPHEYVYKPRTYGYNSIGYSNQYGYYDASGVWHSYKKTNGILRTEKDKGVCNSHTTTQEQTKKKLEEKPKDNEIQKFFDEENSVNTTEDWVSELCDEETDLKGMPLTEELHDELYDVIYSLICSCPNASYEMIRSAVTRNYPFLKDGDLNQIYTEVKHDMYKYMTTEVYD